MKKLLLFFIIFTLGSCLDEEPDYGNIHISNVCLIKTFFNDVYSKYPCLNYTLENNGNYQPWPTAYDNQYYKYHLCITYNEYNDTLYNSINELLFKNFKGRLKYNNQGLYNDEYSGSAYFNYDYMNHNRLQFDIWCNHVINDIKFY